eukprot:TRINITY_DN31052_c0_g1_i1.p1 TRINITY_DN31052_c0_g1~~TRINITY_DN31052_c0_g1_i1.p1  ORF type:complete len:825 (+),score=102.19 TRINITY_DN31052_c0_g1_i1:95-2569(+)
MKSHGAESLNDQEAWALLSMMGISGKQKTTIYDSLFSINCTSASLADLLDAVSGEIGCSQHDIASMLARIPVYERAFRNIDADGSGKISCSELLQMLGTLGIDTSSSADLMAFLDEDGSGEVTWFEFVEGLTHETFVRRFPYVTLEMLCTVPSCLDGEKVISQAEEAKVTENLPFFEKFLFWVLKAMSPGKENCKTATTDNNECKPPAKPSPLEHVDCPPESPTALPKTGKSSDFVTMTPITTYSPSCSKTSFSKTTCSKDSRMNSKRSRLAASPASPSGLTVSGNKVWVATIYRTDQVMPVSKTHGRVRRPEHTKRRKQPRILFARRGQDEDCVVAPQTSNMRTNDLRTNALASHDVAAIMRTKHMQVNEEVKSHILSQKQRRGMWLCIWGALCSGCLAGVGAGIFADVLNTYAGTLVSEEDEVILYYTLTSVLSLIWSIAEMIVCCIAGLIFTVRMTKICGITLIPMDRERAILAGSLARSVLELGHPQDRLYGVNPLRRSGRFCILINALIYMSSRGAVKFLCKMAVKKVGPRTALKQLPFAGLLIEIFVNVVFNGLAVRYAMLAATICCLGPSACVECVSQLIRYRHERYLQDQPHAIPAPLSDDVKWLSMRCVAVAITWKANIHPNNRHLLNHLCSLFVDDALISRMEKVMYSGGHRAASHRRDSMKEERQGSQGCCCCRRRPSSKVQDDDQDGPQAEHVDIRLENLGLDHETELYEGLSKLTSEHDISFVLSVLVLACIIDGSVGSQDWQCLCMCGKVCGRQPNWTHVEFLVNLYANGRAMTVESIHAVFDGSQQESAACCESLHHRCRSLLNSLNIF